MIVFVSGAVRSGKSEVAEACAIRLASVGRVHYIAAAPADDGEMAGRIRRHQERRAATAARWVVWEAPFSSRGLTASLRADDVVLLDCLTTWWAAELFAGDDWKTMKTADEAARRLLDEVRAWAGRCRAVVVVSNELFSGGVPDDEGTFRYMKTLGWLHQQLVAAARAAAVVECGLLRVKKGRWPQ
ncbi:bifunctional adenosylcobinamide kinase/adenosylcobinamide-phosphate guanylyltransferase [Geobacillus sp. C56-T2]|uniref:bifunctional adenosylcobinamide kinase/adenosylcobinamide-phosphate guanylyltransferase n=1 Tax=Geobacillus sp. C56-T2 TaxID=600773 RepID=UPI0011A94F17|nr:bifunctional adenosylcobinamide kinase/adenosylcobinamide-phosphate guanylyltransferase [Geobacillus sp. C56-T2]NNV05719.1 bifunctional adenosylcobinamide kinase/adenosylcobinamide-phosphate guanylyltransferase [Geobacillus sp. MMMUD3]TWG31028.1 adenosylcobinamide kinase /adenosylcobinamide-phosphate guanylyltransferase [Geobacillus sp. C56-T2]